MRWVGEKEKKERGDTSATGIEVTIVPMTAMEATTSAAHMMILWTDNTPPSAVRKNEDKKKRKKTDGVEIWRTKPKSIASRTSRNIGNSSKEKANKSPNNKN